jgi:hypothetical protein
VRHSGHFLRSVELDETVAAAIRRELDVLAPLFATR